MNDKQPLTEEIEDGFDKIHGAIRNMNENYNMSPEARLKLVQIGQIVTTQFNRLRLKSNEWVNNELPF